MHADSIKADSSVQIPLTCVLNGSCKDAEAVVCSNWKFTYYLLCLHYSTWMMEGKTIDTAIRVGYRHFDCSAFHDNQAEMGEALQKLFQEGVVKREDLFFTEKLGFVI